MEFEDVKQLNQTSRMYPLLVFTPPFFLLLSFHPLRMKKETPRFSFMTYD